MARQLWILRHGEAVPHDSRSADDDRELTPRGEEQARDAGAAMAKLFAEIAAAYASPKVRARETARLACAALGVEPVEYGPLRAGFDAGDAEALLLAEKDGAKVLVVGHEPDLSQVVHDLTGARIDLKKGGLAVVEGATLKLLLRPRELQAIAS